MTYDFFEINRGNLNISLYHSKIKFNLFDNLVHHFDNCTEFLQLFLRSSGCQFKMLLKVIISSSAAVVPEKASSYLFKEYKIFAEHLHFYLVKIKFSLPLIQVLVFVFILVF